MHYLKFPKVKAGLRMANHGNALARVWVVGDYIVTGHFMLPVQNLAASDRAKAIDTATLLVALGINTDAYPAPNSEACAKAGPDFVSQIEKTACNRYSATRLFASYDSDMCRLYRCDETGKWTAFRVKYLEAIGEPDTLYMSDPKKAATDDPLASVPCVIMPHATDHLEALLNSEPASVAVAA